jgi:hypothetical protein
MWIAILTGTAFQFTMKKIEGTLLAVSLDDPSAENSC